MEHSLGPHVTAYFRDSLAEGSSEISAFLRDLGQIVEERKESNTKALFPERYKSVMRHLNTTYKRSCTDDSGHRWDVYAQQSPSWTIDSSKDGNIPFPLRNKNSDVVEL